MNTLKANIVLSVHGDTVNIEIQVPTANISPRKMLPVFRHTCTTIVASCVAHAESRGISVSCAAGCGACCRQLVPISATEAVALKHLIDQLPEPRRSEILKRFREAKAKLADSGLLEKLAIPNKPVGEEYRDLGLQYFRLGIPCPFLEDESCSIHPERPLVCREYLVVSDPENCARNNGRPVEVIRIAGEASRALLAIDGTSDREGWIPLTLAVEWAETHTVPETARPGKEIVQNFFAQLLT